MATKVANPVYRQSAPGLHSGTPLAMSIDRIDHGCKALHPMEQHVDTPWGDALL